MLTPTPIIPGSSEPRVGAAPTLSFGPRRGVYLNAAERILAEGAPLDAAALARHEQFDLLYRTLCAVMYNYVPLSGHPGGSISSGRFVTALLFGAMDYDLRDPVRDDADLVCYAAGHKALGLYALWALRNEIARLGAPDLLPNDEKFQLRLEDLLGFRRNPQAATPLFRQFKAKALDGHPTPGTPFVRLSTGASGVGLPASLGLAWAAADTYGDDAPRVHIVEGEGGLTPGRVAEALAMAGTASLGNVVLHVDWNQASIDSNRVCRDGTAPGDYVQWTPAELAYLHDWNVIYVPDGFNFQEIITAQRLARSFDNGQPTAIVYRTVKGWQYGIEGRAAHGAGHPLCSAGFQAAVSALFPNVQQSLPCCEPGAQRCAGGADGACIEQCYWDALQAIRRALTERPELIEDFAARLRAAHRRLNDRHLHPRANAPQIEAAYTVAARATTEIPAALKLAPGTKTTLRDELGRVFNHYNKVTHGGLVIAAADLLGSTSISKAVEGFPAGFYHRRSNPLSRQLATGGIAEDAMTAILAGIATYGRHTGAGSSYAAFSAPLGHIAARLHAIGNHARTAVEGGHNRPFFIVAAHAGLKTGEDGPTHADPQALQLLQDNFPVGAMITLTPWDPQEIWYLVSAALARRPAVIAPFVTRPPEIVPDRAALGLPPAALAAQGVYRLRTSREGRHGTIVLQGTGVTNAFVFQTLPKLVQAGIDPNVYVVTSTELFDAMPAADRARVFPEAHQQEAMGITDFTLATMTRWVRSDHGRAHTLHPFRQGHYLGSGSGAMVMAEAGLDGASQFEAIQAYLKSR